MKKSTPNVATHLLENPAQYLLKIGKIIRKKSLDELPNLVNIIKGEMAFVGPRPALYNQDDLMQFRVATGVSKIKPGITGWAQINGRDEISIPEKLEVVDYETNIPDQKEWKEMFRLQSQHNEHVKNLSIKLFNHIILV